MDSVKDRQLDDEIMLCRYEKIIHWTKEKISFEVFWWYVLTLQDTFAKQFNPHYLEEESQQESDTDSEENSDDLSTELMAELSNKVK